MTRQVSMGSMAKVKFSSKMESSLLKELRAHAKDAKVNIADVLSDAVSQHLQVVRVRSVFRKAVEETISENAELYSRLAK